MHASNVLNIIFALSLCLPFSLYLHSESKLHFSSVQWAVTLDARGCLAWTALGIILFLRSLYSKFSGRGTHPCVLRPVASYIYTVLLITLLALRQYCDRWPDIFRPLWSINDSVSIMAY